MSQMTAAPPISTTLTRSNKRQRGAEKKESSIPPVLLGNEGDAVATTLRAGEEDATPGSGSSTTPAKADTPNQMVQDYVELASHIMLHPLNAIRQAALATAQRNANQEANGNAEGDAASSTSSTPAPILPPPQSQYLVHLSALGYLKSAVRRPMVIERWSPYEIALFEAALAEYGKDFSKVQREIGANKTVGDVIEFYYLWKKTTHYERWKTEYIPEHLDVHDDD